MLASVALPLAVFGEYGTPLLIGVFGSTGILGVILTLAKFPGDRALAAITQAQGANEALEAALEAMERQSAYWERRYVTEHERANDLSALVANLQLQLQGKQS